MEPIKGGSVYHVDCYKLQEAKNKKREEKQKEEEAKKEEVKEEPQVSVKEDPIDDLISFDSLVSFNKHANRLHFASSPPDTSSLASSAPPSSERASQSPPDCSPPPTPSSLTPLRRAYLLLRLLQLLRPAVFLLR